MVAYCESVLERIKSSLDESEIREIVTLSFDEFRRSNVNVDEAFYTMNMIVILNASQEGASEYEQKNIEVALACFRDVRRQSQELLF